MLPLEIILHINKISNDALDKAEKNLQAANEILKGLGK